MTLRKFLMCYLGGVLFVGTAGASGYQILARQHGQVAAAAQASGAGVPQAVAAVEPVAAEEAPAAAVDSPSQRRAAALPSLRPHVATNGTGHASQPSRLAERRPAVAAHPAHRAVAQAVTPPRPVSPAVSNRYAAVSQPGAMYARPPAPTVTYYPYPGYVYYYPRYQYYRVY